MTPSYARNTAGGTTLDGVLDALVDVAAQQLALSACGASQMQMSVTMAQAQALLLIESQKHTALLTEIRDQLRKGLLVKTVLTL